MDITADPFLPAPMVFFTGLFGAALMVVLWRQRVTGNLVPSTHRAYLLAAFGSLFGAGEGLNRMGVNPAGLSVYLTWAAFVPMCATLLYFSTMSFNKLAYTLHQNERSLLRGALGIVSLAKFGAIAGFAYVVISELFDWISVGFDVFIATAALFGLVLSKIVLDMMYYDDWTGYAMAELKSDG